MRRVQGAGVIPSFITATYFAFGPGLTFSAAYFGTPFFGLGIAIAWLLAQRMILLSERSLNIYIYFAFVCLIVGLIRPEGVLISVFMLLSIGVIGNLRDFCRLLLVFGGFFFILGGIYFIWRWDYFGYPLPNPFYKKGGGRLYIDSFLNSILNSLYLLYPFILAVFLSIYRITRLRLVVSFSIPIAASIAMWIFLSNEMNYAGRFQYPVFIIGILSWFPMIQTFQTDFFLPKFRSLHWTWKWTVSLIASCVIGLIFTQRIRKAVRLNYSKDGRYEIGIMLNKYASRGYTLATTETGLLPLYSKWHTIDTWGLNDSWIAHNNGLITDEYLDRKRPDIIIWNGFLFPLNVASVEQKTPLSLWSKHVQILYNYVKRNKFTLAAVFGAAPSHTHSYFVRRDLPDHDEIVQRIRKTDYIWFLDGRKSNNYAKLKSTESTVW